MRPIAWISTRSLSFQTGTAVRRKSRDSLCEFLALTQVEGIHATQELSKAFDSFTFPAWANLVQNPGFETGDLTSWTSNFAAYSPWVLRTGAPTIDSFSINTGYVGDTCINGTAAQQASLSQTIATVSGQNYVLASTSQQLMELRTS